MFGGDSKVEVMLAVAGLGSFVGDMKKAKEATGEVAKSATELGKTSNSKFQGVVDDVGKLGAAFVKKAAVAGAAMVGVGAVITGLVVSAGKFQSIRDAFSTMTEGMGLDGKKIVADLKKATAGVMEEQDIMANFMKATMMIGRDALGETGENFERMAVIARKAARATGQDADELFDNLVTGIGRTNTKLFENLGILVDSEAAYKRYGAEIGKSGKELDMMEKRQAMLNEVLRIGESVYEDVAVSAGGIASAWKRVQIGLQETRKELGLAFEPLVTPIVKGFGEMTVAAKEFVTSNVVPAMENLLSVFQGFGEAVRTGDIGQLTESLQNMGLSGGGLDLVVRLLQKVAGLFVELKKGADAFIDGFKKQFGYWIPVIKQSFMKLGDEVLKMFGMGGDESESFAEKMAKIAPIVADLVAGFIVGAIEVIAFLVKIMVKMKEWNDRMIELGAGIRNWWSGVRHDFNEGKERIKAIWEDLKSAFRGGWEEIKGFFSSSWAFITNGARDAVARIQGFFGSLSFSIRDILNNAIITRIQNTVNSVIWAANNMIQALTGKRPIGNISIPRLAQGGVIDGESYSGDKIIARVNSGEMVLTRGQQGALFNLLKNMSVNRSVNFNAPVNFGGQRTEMQQENVFTKLLLGGV